MAAAKSPVGAGCRWVTGWPVEMERLSISMGRLCRWLGWVPLWVA